MTPRLLALSNLAGTPDSEPFLRACAEECRPGAVGVVLRDRELPYGVREALASRLNVQSYGQKLIVSDRVDLALALNADGVHLPANGLPASQVRSRNSGWLSRAWHDLWSLADSEVRALDALIISPVFRALKGRSALGLSALESAATEIKAQFPHLALFALGGVTDENAGDCLKAGMDGVAVMTPIVEEARRFRLYSELDILRGAAGSRDSLA